MQRPDDGFGSWGTVNSESCAQAIVALTAPGIDLATDSDFGRKTPLLWAPWPRRFSPQPSS